MAPEEHLLTSASGEYSRKSWLWQAGKGNPRRACILMDGEYYLERFDLPQILTDLVARELIEPMACLFITLQDRESRHHDYTCNPRYARFIAEDSFDWLRKRFPYLADDDHMIGGLSLSGLASAHIVLTYPERFSRALCQSGSFWWNEEYLAGNLDQFTSDRKGRFWVSAGDQETQSDLTHSPTGLYQRVSQIAACERFAEALTERQHQVNYHMFEGTHSIEPWKKELPEAFTWLLSTPALPDN